MGLFDKKIKKPADDAYDYRVEDAPLSPAAVTPVPSVVVSSVRAPEKVPGPLDADHPDYGINKAIELMRRLPVDNVELVVRVVKTTLESTNIKVAGIIKDATRKLGGIESRVDVLKKEIVGLENQIETRRGEISALEADHKETSTVKERLLMAEKASGGDKDAEPRGFGAGQKTTASGTTSGAAATGTSSSDPHS